MIARAIAMGFGLAIDLTSGGNDEVCGHVVGELGGFFVTLITGTISMALCAVCEFVLQRFIFRRKHRLEKSGEA